MPLQRIKYDVTFPAGEVLYYKEKAKVTPLLKVEDLKAFRYALAHIGLSQLLEITSLPGLARVILLNR